MTRPTKPLTREALADDSFKQAMLDEAPGAMSLMDPEAFEASRQHILKQAETAGDLWVFAYGSLIWNPIIEVAEERRAHLDGYARRFCVWAPIGRGTPERPGLWLALDKGDGCSGVALRIEQKKWDEETRLLWRREMISGVYRPVMVPVDLGGAKAPCLVFLVNRQHDRYAHGISEAAKVEALARGAGSLGTCREYLFTLESRLKAHCLQDAYIETLASTVRQIAPPDMDTKNR